MGHHHGGGGGGGGHHGGGGFRHGGFRGGFFPGYLDPGPDVYIVDTVPDAASRNEAASSDSHQKLWPALAGVGVGIALTLLIFRR